MGFCHILETVKNNVYIVYNIARSKSIYYLILIHEELGNGAFIRCEY